MFRRELTIRECWRTCRFPLQPSTRIFLFEGLDPGYPARGLHSEGTFFSEYTTMINHFSTTDANGYKTGATTGWTKASSGAAIMLAPPSTCAIARLRSLVFRVYGFEFRVKGFMFEA